METTPAQDSRVNFIPAKSHVNWDQYFMLQAFISSFKSKDPNTKVGCVIVDDQNHQVTMGYNGFVAGIDETQLPWGRDTSVPLEYQKYGYVVHSEANAILHAKRSLKGTRAYVTLFPCQECAKLIASSGVKEVIFHSNKYEDSEGHRIAKRIFDLSAVKYRQLLIGEDLVQKLSDFLSEQVADY